MEESLDRQIYVRLADLEGEALDAFAASQNPPVTRSAVMRAAAIKLLVASGKLPSDYNPVRRTKHQIRAGRETVIDMTTHDTFSR